MKYLISTLLMFICLRATAGGEKDLSGKDAEFLMDSIKGGGVTSSGNPNQGVATSLALQVSKGGFDLACKTTGLLFINTACRVKVNPEIQDPSVKIEELTDRYTLTFSDPDFVGKLTQSLRQNPWKSETRAASGVELVTLDCKSVCTLNLAK